MYWPNKFTEKLKIEYPIIGGPMYPCSNPELVAAVSENGGIGVIQPISLTYVYKYDLREGIQFIRSLTKKPVGLNLLIESSNKTYEDKMKKTFDIAMEEGVRFFITSLGNPKWFVERSKGSGAIFFHDVTEKKWAEKGISAGVDGFVCVNNRAGGHAGDRSPQELFEEIKTLGLPLISAGGIGSRDEFLERLKMGYSGVQIGTRLIATVESKASPEYKAAILKAKANDIVFTEKISGVNVAVINTPRVQAMGTKAGPIARRLLRHPTAKKWVRSFYALRSFYQLKQAQTSKSGNEIYWQAGRSVETINKIESVKAIFQEWVH